jgi:zinc transport system substrate-binding protein
MNPRACGFSFCLMALVTALCFCMLFPGKALARDKIRVVASIFPLAEMARAVGGERVTVDLLLPPGSEPHSWAPKPSDMLRLEQAEVILLVGADMEPWTQDFARTRGKRKSVVIQAVEGAPLLRVGQGQGHPKAAEEHEDGHQHRGVDPHIWLDFKWDIVLVNKMVDIFSALDPEGAAVHRKHGDDYGKKLEELDRAYETTLASCSGKTMVIGGHAAFGYLARNYGLEQVALFGLSPDASPTPRRMAELTDLIRARGVKAIFFDETASDKLTKTLARETGVQTMVLAPGASLTRDDIDSGITFIDLMYRNLSSLTAGLGCVGPGPQPPEK